MTRRDRIQAELTYVCDLYSDVMPTSELFSRVARDGSISGTVAR